LHAPDAAKQVVVDSVAGDGIAQLHVPESAKVTLERCDEVIAVPGVGVAVHIFRRLPLKTVLVGGRVAVEPIKWVLAIARPAPHLPAGTPNVSSCGEVGAEEAGHLPPVNATVDTLPFPSPKGVLCS